MGTYDNVTLIQSRTETSAIFVSLVSWYLFVHWQFGVHRGHKTTVDLSLQTVLDERTQTFKPQSSSKLTERDIQELSEVCRGDSTGLWAVGRQSVEKRHPKIFRGDLFDPSLRFPVATREGGDRGPARDEIQGNRENGRDR